LFQVYIFSSKKLMSPSSNPQQNQQSRVQKVVETAQNAVNYAQKTVEPFTPKPVKDAVEYSIQRAKPIVTGTVDYAQKTVCGTVDYAQKTVNGTVNYAQKTVNGTVNYAQKTVNGTVNYAQKTVNGTVDYAQKTVNGTVDYAQKTAKGTVDYASKQISSATSFASSKANSALEFGKVVVSGATTTIHAHTPGPVLSLVQTTLDGANALRQDPIGTVKPYVPTFIIHIGEKSYEIVGQVTEQTSEGIKLASGFVVTKVNGTTQYVTSVPLIATIIEKLQVITKPIIEKFGKKGEDGSVSVDVGEELEH
jgi:hypothetical protein